jgi:oligosaccharide repeat unit polymerase
MYHLVCFIVCILLIDFKNLLSTRNIFLLYTGLAFSWASSVYFPEIINIPLEGIIYMVLFILGYSFRKTKKTVSANYFGQQVHLNKEIRFLKTMVVGACILQLGNLVVSILKSGFSNYYSGQALVDKIADFGSGYGLEDVNSGFNIIYLTFSELLKVVVVIMYVQRSLKIRLNLQYQFVSIPLIILPLLSLQRVNIIFGSLFLLFTVLYDYKVKGLVIPRKVAATGSFFVILVITAGFSIGVLRENRLNIDRVDYEDGTVSEQLFGLVRGELSTVRFYEDVKQNINFLGFQHGNTVFLPVILRFVPRAWFPGKPENSAGYVMQMLYPAAFAAGFSLAPSIFGDLYLNFGYTGIIIIVVLLGYCCRYFDCKFFEGDLEYFIPTSLFFYNFYSFVRNNVSASVGDFCIAWILASLIAAILVSSRTRVVSVPEF